MKSKTTNAENGVESTVEKRARFERFSMTVLGGKGAGRVNVCNLSYGSESRDHIYTVRVENGEAVECTCPADKYHSGPCKHRVAVQNRPLVVSSASAASASYSRPATQQVAADGGETAETCENGHVGCPGPYHLIRAMCEDCTDKSRADLTEGVVNRTFGK